MADFNEFVQLELPRRPFVSIDGAPGQTLIRSNNPHAVRELIWSNLLNDLQDRLGDLDPNLAVVSDADGNLISSPITVSELEMLDGVTYNIQVQMNAKSPLVHNHAINEISGWDGIDGGDSGSVFMY